MLNNKFSRDLSAFALSPEDLFTQKEVNINHLYRRRAKFQFIELLKSSQDRLFVVGGYVGDVRTACCDVFQTVPGSDPDYSNCIL